MVVVSAVVVNPTSTSHTKEQLETRVDRLGCEYASCSPALRRGLERSGVVDELCRSATAQEERDVSVRQRAVDLLYAMCDRSNSEDIVLEMLTYLETADYSIREEMVRNLNK